MMATLMLLLLTAVTALSWEPSQSTNNINILRYKNVAAMMEKAEGKNQK